IEAIWIIKKTTPILKRSFAYENLTWFEEGLYFLYLPLKRSRFAPKRTKSGDTHKASPSFTSEPCVTFTKIKITTREMIWPHRSIKDDAAGSWSASRIVVIILNTNDRQKYVKTIMANFVTSG